MSAARARTEVVLTLRLGRALYALPLASVVEVLPFLPIATLPGCPEFLLGVVFVRGHLIPILDAAERLGLRNHTRVADPHIVCVEIRGRLVGILVDEALDLAELPTTAALGHEDLGLHAGFFRGAVHHAGETIRLLDATRVVLDAEMVAIRELPATASAPPGGSLR